MTKVRDVMTTGVVTIASNATAIDAARLMRDQDIGVLPVLDGGEIVAMLTDRDIVVRAVAENQMNAPVGSIASRDVAWLSPDDDTNDIQDQMADWDVRRMPVMENGQLVGIVSVGDLAVRANSKIAGRVMEQTGPSA